MNQKFERLATLLASRQFLLMQGIGNEAPIFIQPYPPTSENEVAIHIDRLTSRLQNTGLSVLRIDLFKLTVFLIDRVPGRLEKFLQAETTRPKNLLRTDLGRIANAEKAIVPAIARLLKDESHDLVLISGVGQVFPFLRTQTILENLQPAMVAKPVVVFFPGKYVQMEGLGSALRLFGCLPDRRYYRAFNLDDYHIHESP
jgi:Domain of unknown function (DUF1788)